MSFSAPNKPAQDDFTCETSEQSQTYSTINTASTSKASDNACEADDEPRVEAEPRKLFPTCSIAIMAEQSDVRMELGSSSEKILATALDIRLRELVKCSIQFMSHASRTKLTTKDLSRAFKELDCHTIFGHNNSARDFPRYRYVPEAKVYIEDSPVVALRRRASKVIAQRFAPDYQDVSKSASGFTIDWFQSRHFICDIFDNVDFIFAPNEFTSKLDNYFEHLCDILLKTNCSKYSHLSPSERDALLRHIFRDLSSNKNIKSILNRFINFVLNALQTLQQQNTSLSSVDSSVVSQAKLDSYRIYYRTLRSLIHNPHFVDWALQSHLLEPLVKTLLSVCFGPHHYGPEGQLFHDYLRMQSHFAHLICQILFKFCLPFTNIQNRLISILYAKIRSYHAETSSLSSAAAVYCAILVLHRYLGFDMCLRYLMPLITQHCSPFQEHLSGNIDQDRVTKQNRSIVLQNSIIDSAFRSELCLVAELIMKGLALLLVQVTDNFVSVENSNDIYAFFVDHFGDALSARLSPLPDLADVKSSRSQWLSTWRTKVAPKTTNHVVDYGTFQSQSRRDSTAKFDLLNTSPSGRNRKRKGTGLLESMLSTDTTQMAKNESLSMFSESLLGASYPQHKQKMPLKYYLYQEDCDALSGDLILFDGIRLQPKYDDTSENGTDTFDSKRLHAAKPSDWYNLSPVYTQSRVKMLPGMFGSCFSLTTKDIEHIELEEEELLTSYTAHLGITNEARVQFKRVSSEARQTRHRLFHYHRNQQHLRTNFSLYTLL